MSTSLRKFDCAHSKSTKFGYESIRFATSTPDSFIQDQPVRIRKRQRRSSTVLMTLNNRGVRANAQRQRQIATPASTGLFSANRVREANVTEECFNG
jgi:hypothetical protein